MSGGDSPWLDVRGVCRRIGVGRKVVYAAIASGRLRASHIDGRRSIRVHVDWCDAWLIAAAPQVTALPHRNHAIRGAVASTGGVL